MTWLLVIAGAWGLAAVPAALLLAGMIRRAEDARPAPSSVRGTELGWDECLHSGPQDLRPALSRHDESPLTAVRNPV